MIALTVNITSWADRWTLAGISVATVFVILVILVLVLQIFSYVARKAKLPMHHAGHNADGSPASLAEASEADKAAIATTLYLYYSNRHDVESGILTINPNRSSAWHAVVDENQ